MPYRAGTHDNVVHKQVQTFLHVIIVRMSSLSVNMHSCMQAQRQALAAQFRSATQHVYAQLTERRYVTVS